MSSEDGNSNTISPTPGFATTTTSSNANPSTQAQQPNQPPQCTPATADRVSVAKDYMRQYYERVVNEERSFVKEHSKPKIKKTTVDDYQLQTLIGRGAFGEVRLCYKKDDPNKTIVAMKICRKEVMIQRNQVHHVRSERELMVETKKKMMALNLGGNSCFSEWAVELYKTFQDDDHLYFVMEFCPGGDLMHWLIKKDIFSEDEARFYIAELVLAVETLHRMGYAHRDLKPDNCLLDSNGHIKLTDFGLCKQIPKISAEEAAQLNALQNAQAKLDAESGGGAGGGPNPNASEADIKRRTWKEIRKREMFFTTVGSPGYIAPEILEKKGYGLECDWWAIGVILYEMLCGYPPFYGEDSKQTGQKILRWREYLEFPKGKDAISKQATDLIIGLLTDAKYRMGFEQVCTHPFFAGVDWVGLRHKQAPFPIVLSSPSDTRYFDAITEQTPPMVGAAAKKAAGGGGGGGGDADKKLLFFGFTSRFDQDTGLSTTAMGNQGRKQGPAIPDFNDDDEEEEEDYE